MAFSLLEKHSLHRGAWSGYREHVGGRTAVKAEATATLTRPRDTGVSQTSKVVTGPPELQPQTGPTVADCDTTAVPLSSGLDFVDLIDLDDYTVHSRLQDAVTYRMLVGSASRTCVDPNAGCFNLKQLKSYRDNVTRNLAPTVAYGFANAGRAAERAISATQFASPSTLPRPTSPSLQSPTTTQPGARPTPYQPKPVTPRQIFRPSQSSASVARDSINITRNQDHVQKIHIDSQHLLKQQQPQQPPKFAAESILSLRSSGASSGAGGGLEYAPGAAAAATQSRRRGSRGAGRGVAVAGAGRSASAGATASTSTLSSWIL